MEAVRLIRLDRPHVRTATTGETARPALRTGGLVYFKRPLDGYDWVGRVACILEPDNATPLVLVMSRHADGFPMRPLLTPADRVSAVRGEAAHAFGVGASVYRVSEAILGRRLVVRSQFAVHPCILDRTQVDCVGCRWLGGHDNQLVAYDLCYRVECPSSKKTDAVPEHWLAAWVDGGIAEAA